MIAQKADPALWEEAKRAACRRSKLLCPHSARKMQWASRYYRQHGGRYASPRRSGNALRKWTRARWRTHDGSLSEGKRRYLPSAAWATLTPDQVRRTNASKRAGHRRGRQYVAQPADVRRAVWHETRKGNRKNNSV